MSPCFGIDLGTTNSVIAHLVDGRPRAIPIDGHPTMPSLVLYQNGRIVVGREARNLEFQYPEQTIRSVKRKMGQSHRYMLGGKERSPEEISAEILGALKRGAEAATGMVVEEAVITVPAYFDDAQRRATLRAGEQAGLHVLRLLNEPTSASLVYDRVAPASGSGAGDARPADEPEIVLVYDLGGGTFDVSVLEVMGDVREVRATTGNTHLGGDDFDEQLVRLFLDELKRLHGVDPRDDPRAMARLRRLAEDTKIRLSGDTQVMVREEFLTAQGGRPVHLEMEVTRRRFEALIEPLLRPTLTLAQHALDDARLGSQALGRICLVGGSTRIPLVRQLLAETFQVDIHEEVDPDLAVGLGAALEAGLLTGEPVDRLLVDVASHSLGVRALGPDDDPYIDKADTFVPVLRRNTVLPAQRTEELYTVQDGQREILVAVYQGESPRASQNTRIGEFVFPLVSCPAQSPVRVEFTYDLNGVVNVAVSQPGTRNAKAVALIVPDASGTSAEGPGGGGAVPSALERKVRALLADPDADLDAEDREEAEALLERYRTQTGEDRLPAEEALLDLLLSQDAGDEDAGDEDDLDEEDEA
ncbi:MAG TPA: Hsp70 family protein [Polyangia bacterium]|jgi:molecular chaperone DnaK|nr:Hsp70 family protein [Polyangia bacterium]